MIKDVTQSLDIYLFMLSRWRKEHFEGKLVADERKVIKQLISVPKKKTDNFLARLRYDF